MCTRCYFDRYVSSVKMDNGNVSSPARIITLYHEGFTAAEIAEIISDDLEWVAIVIEERA